jgi:hypothetical protein
MFGFQKFTSTYSCRFVWLGMLMLLCIHWAVFSEYANGNAGIMRVIPLLLLLLALLVMNLSNRVAVVYWDGELEDVSKDMFVTALESDNIPLIDDYEHKLDVFMRKYIFLSSKEIKLLDRNIAQIKLEVSKFKTDLEDI